MDRRKFILSSALVALHSRSSSALKNVLQTDAAIPEQTLRDQLMRDPLRPQYHLLPQAGRVGDPCAPLFYRGQHHVFFHGSFGGGGWQHAISPDLIHWRHLPIALSRTPDSYDSRGTFTGSFLPGTEGASIVYTGVTVVPTEQETIRNEGLREVQCIATSTDADLRSWHKLDKPVIEGPPPGVKITGFRDPAGGRMATPGISAWVRAFQGSAVLCCSIVRRMPATGSTFILSRRERGTVRALQIQSPVVRCGSALTSFRSGTSMS